MWQRCQRNLPAVRLKMDARRHYKKPHDEDLDDRPAENRAFDRRHRPTITNLEDDWIDDRVHSSSGTAISDLLQSVETSAEIMEGQMPNMAEVRRKPYAGPHRCRGSVPFSVAPVVDEPLRASLVQTSQSWVRCGLTLLGGLLLVGGLLAVVSWWRSLAHAPLASVEPEPSAPSTPPWDRFWLVPPPPRLPVAAETVANLNKRFSNGHPSSELVDAGVLVHTFDSLADYEQAWKTCDEETWCWIYSDRFSASLINRRLPSYYMGANRESTAAEAMGGLIIDPRRLAPINASIFCSWIIDAGTMGMQCEQPGASADCTPGCSPGFGCTTLGYETDYCWWSPGELRQMMEHHEHRLRTQTREQRLERACGQPNCKCVPPFLPAQSGILPD